MCRFGLPGVIISDNRTQFTITIVVDFCYDLGVKTNFIFVIYPHANGQAQSSNKVILKGDQKEVRWCQRTLEWSASWSVVVISYHPSFNHRGNFLHHGIWSIQDNVSQNRHTLLVTFSVQHRRKWVGDKMSRWPNQWNKRCCPHLRVLHQGKGGHNVQLRSSIKGNARRQSGVETSHRARPVGETTT